MSRLSKWQAGWVSGMGLALCCGLILKGGDSAVD